MYSHGKFKIEKTGIAFMADLLPTTTMQKRIMGPSWREVPLTVVMATERRVANLPALTYYWHQQKADILTCITNQFELYDVNNRGSFLKWWASVTIFNFHGIIGTCVSYFGFHLCFFIIRSTSVVSFQRIAFGTCPKNALV